MIPGDSSEDWLTNVALRPVVSDLNSIHGSGRGPIVAKLFFPAKSCRYDRWLAGRKHEIHPVKEWQIKKASPFPRLGGIRHP